MILVLVAGAAWWLFGNGRDGTTGSGPVAGALPSISAGDQQGSTGSGASMVAGAPGPSIAISDGVYAATDLVHLEGRGFQPGSTAIVSIVGPFGQGRTLHDVISPGGSLDITFVADPNGLGKTHNVTVEAGGAIARTSYEVSGKS